MKEKLTRSYKLNWIIASSISYLVLPFVIFCLSFLKMWIGLPVAFIACWAAWRLIKSPHDASEDIKLDSHDVVIALGVLILWIYLSGIGGFTFQNPDHHVHNAVLYDLISYDWPVYYQDPPDVASNQTYALIYYIGYWLPTALFGKIFGWQAANIFLFIWTCLGVFQTVLMIKSQLKSSLLVSSIFLILFGGMDILAVIIIQLSLRIDYPYLWPPISHLEVWNNLFQFSSFTTQLFWVFNQAVPTWICMGLISTVPNRKSVLFIWSLCFFFSPIPAVGMIPYILLTIPEKAFNPKSISVNFQKLRNSHLFRNLLSDCKGIISFENLVGGGLVLITASLYFSSSPSAATIRFKSMDLFSGIVFLFFLIIDGLLLWTLFFRENQRNLWWYCTGLLLFLSPLIAISTGIDFCMRASIPSLLLLMCWAGESFLRKPTVKYRGALILLLALGVFTPLYEINRSIYRTIKYYSESNHCVEEEFLPAGTRIIQFADIDHPCSLQADLYRSLAGLNPNAFPHRIGKTDASWFFEYLAVPPAHNE